MFRVDSCLTQSSHRTPTTPPHPRSLASSRQRRAAAHRAPKARPAEHACARVRMHYMHRAQTSLRARQQLWDHARCAHPPHTAASARRHVLFLQPGVLCRQLVWTPAPTAPAATTQQPVRLGPEPRQRLPRARPRCSCGSHCRQAIILAWPPQRISRARCHGACALVLRLLCAAVAAAAAAAGAWPECGRPPHGQRAAHQRVGGTEAQAGAGGGGVCPWQGSRT